MYYVSENVKYITEILSEFNNMKLCDLNHQMYYKNFSPVI